MITAERHRIILETLKRKNIITIQEIIDETNTSESTIRRDLVQLEEKKLLKRVHGGASRFLGKLEEPDMNEKATKNLQEKEAIARYAVSLINQGDCIYLDAGTTTMQMIKYLEDQMEIVVVTNGITNLNPLLNKGIKTYVVGGLLKPSTNAMIGKSAIKSILDYRFDKCFLGVNGIHPTLGYTTPDPEEAAVKQKALELSGVSYVLADETKLNEVAFSEIADISKAIIITNHADEKNLELYREKTDVKVVTS